MPSQRSLRKASLPLILSLLLNSAVPAFALKEQSIAERSGLEELGDTLQQFASAAGLLPQEPVPTVRPTIRPLAAGVEEKGWQPLTVQEMKLRVFGDWIKSPRGEEHMVRRFHEEDPGSPIQSRIVIYEGTNESITESQIKAGGWTFSKGKGTAAGAEQTGENNFLGDLARMLLEADPDVFNILRREYDRQQDNLTLIASETHTHPLVLAAMALSPALDAKYGEGTPERRFYPGMEVLDELERLARWRMLEAFRRIFPEIHEQYWANVQPHSGSNANFAVHMAVLQALDATAGIDLYYGGHLTHGFNLNFSGKLFHSSKILVDPESGEIDWDKVERELLEMEENDRPRLIILGGTAVTTQINWERARQIANKIGAVLVADISHNLGQILAGDYNSPFPHAHFVTFTTHKTLGPRKAIILSRKEVLPGVNEHVGVREKDRQKRTLAELVDAAIIPGTQGGPKFHDIAAAAVWAQVLLSDEFINGFAKQIGINAKALAAALLKADPRVKLVGPKIPQTHLLLMDVRPFGLNGRQAEKALESMGILANANMIPVDAAAELKLDERLRQTKTRAGGIRIGVPGPTSRGMKEPQMQIIAGLIVKILANTQVITDAGGKERAIVKPEVQEGVRRRLREDLTDQFPVLEGWRELFRLVGDQAGALERATAVFSMEFSEAPGSLTERIAHRLFALEGLRNAPSLGNLFLLNAVARDSLEPDEVRASAAQVLLGLPYTHPSQVDLALYALDAFARDLDDQEPLILEIAAVLRKKRKSLADEPAAGAEKQSKIPFSISALSFDELKEVLADEPKLWSLEVYEESVDMGQYREGYEGLKGNARGVIGPVLFTAFKNSVLQRAYEVTFLDNQPGVPEGLRHAQIVASAIRTEMPSAPAAGAEESETYRGIWGPAAEVLDPSKPFIPARPGDRFLLVPVRPVSGEWKPLDRGSIKLIRLDAPDRVSTTVPTYLTFNRGVERAEALQGNLLNLPERVGVLKAVPWTPGEPGGGVRLAGVPILAVPQPAQQGIRFEIEPPPAGDGGNSTRYLVFPLEREDLWQAARDHLHELSGRILRALEHGPKDLGRAYRIGISGSRDADLVMAISLNQAGQSLRQNPNNILRVSPRNPDLFLLQSARRESLVSLRPEVIKLQGKLEEFFPADAVLKNLRTLGIIHPVDIGLQSFANGAARWNPAMTIITARSVAQLKLALEALGLSKVDALLIQKEEGMPWSYTVQEAGLNVPVFLFGSQAVRSAKEGETVFLQDHPWVSYVRYPVSPERMVQMFNRLDEQVERAVPAGMEEEEKDFPSALETILQQQKDGNLDSLTFWLNDQSVHLSEGRLTEENIRAHLQSAVKESPRSRVLVTGTYHGRTLFVLPAGLPRYSIHTFTSLRPRDRLVLREDGHNVLGRVASAAGGKVSVLNSQNHPKEWDLEALAGHYDYIPAIPPVAAGVEGEPKAPSLAERGRQLVRQFQETGELGPLPMAEAMAVATLLGREDPELIFLIPNKPATRDHPAPYIMTGQILRVSVENLALLGETPQVSLRRGADADLSDLYVRAPISGLEFKKVIILDFGFKPPAAGVEQAYEVTVESVGRVVMSVGDVPLEAVKLRLQEPLNREIGVLTGLQLDLKEGPFLTAFRRAMAWQDKLASRPSLPPSFVALANSTTVLALEPTETAEYTDGRAAATLEKANRENLPADFSGHGVTLARYRNLRVDIESPKEIKQGMKLKITFRRQVELPQGSPDQAGGGAGSLRTVLNNTGKLIFRPDTAPLALLLPERGVEARIVVGSQKQEMVLLEFRPDLKGSIVRGYKFASIDLAVEIARRELGPDASEVRGILRDDPNDRAVLWGQINAWLKPFPWKSSVTLEEALINNIVNVLGA